MAEETGRIQAFLSDSDSPMKTQQVALSQNDWLQLARAAWESRSRAYVMGNTRVGAAVMVSDGGMFAGCNVEHRFRCHDVHAEVNAITTMIASGKTELKAIIVVAERDRFTPCGGCMDWIFQFGGPSCFVAYQRSEDGEIIVCRAQDLMPQYPE